MNNTLYWIWLSILNLSQKHKNTLLEIFKEPKELYNINKRKLEKITTSKELIEILLCQKTKEEAKQILKQSEKEKIKIITISDIEYPQNLINIVDRPFVLYAKGNYKLLNKENKIAIVGSRECSEYGKKTTLKFSYLLSRKNCIIVSGMAKGIDTYAHKGALIAKGKTIAVLGSGVNYIYPKENEKLYNEIIEKEGLIISEYPLNKRPIPEYFPYRNRIISGISDKILITEARKKSGSIITANFALEQGKNVYAIPGNITSYKSEGTNMLIKEGAFLVTSLEDILYL